MPAHAGAIDVHLHAGGRRSGSQLVDFGPGYYQLESTYLVSGASGITGRSARSNRAGLRVVAIDGTTTFRASSPHVDRQPSRNRCPQSARRWH